MPSLSKQLHKASYDFFKANNEDFTTDSGAVAPTYTSEGVSLAVTTDSTNSVIYQNDLLFFDIDLVKRVEFLFKPKDLDADSVIHLGMASDYNSDPTATAAHAFLKILGDGTVTAETDDGTNDLSELLEYTVTSNAWHRASIDFSAGVQSISPPGSSIGGKGSVQFSISESGTNRHAARMTKHMDMSNYSAGLQILCNAALSGSTASPSAGVIIQRIEVEHELPNS